MSGVPRCRRRLPTRCRSARRAAREPPADDRRRPFRRIEHAVVRSGVARAEIVAEHRREERVDLTPGEVDEDERERDHRPTPAPMPSTSRSAIACHDDAMIIARSRPIRSDAPAQKIRHRGIGERADRRRQASARWPPGRNDCASARACRVTISPPIAIMTNIAYMHRSAACGASRRSGELVLPGA